jgi:hypothetical protein
MAQYVEVKVVGKNGAKCYVEKYLLNDEQIVGCYAAAEPTHSILDLTSGNWLEVAETVPALLTKLQVGG